ncbi:MAG: carboxypeptidase regulatory-like domain-containing protein, partial [Methylococcaceae bacterium]|nr:carboxypeptidase regulatory-like domain-containing protein [Methylococcaceae bacterium]
MKLRHFLVLSVSLLASLCFWPSGAAAEKSRPVIESLSPEGGAVGVLVTIGGSHFGSRGQVAFGARKGKIVSWTDERIEVTAPKGKGSVKLRVKSRRYGTSKPKVFAYAKPVSGLLNVKVLANNDLGMHCVDESFKVFSILPPYNVVNAQVVAQGRDGKPKLLGDGQVELRYSPIADATGSINSTSLGKSDFWDHVAQAYGMQRAPGQGLKGLYMPADAPADAPPVFSWNPTLNLFSAEGIPILPVDAAGRKNRYPLMRVTAYDSASGTALGFVDAVLPVSEETTCSTCHAKGAPAAVDPAIAWADDPADPQNATRLNILKLHDAKKGTDLEHHQPVLCASCHYSPALDLAGAGPSEIQKQFPTLSAALHANHADKMQSAKDQANLPGQPVVKPEEQACYECHPGRSTECLRGAMTATVTCQNCHGDMAAVGATHPLTAGGDANGLRR